MLSVYKKSEYTLKYSLGYNFSIFTQQGAFVLGIIQNHFPMIIKIMVLRTISEKFVFFSYEKIAIISMRPKTVTANEVIFL